VSWIPLVAWLAAVVVAAVVLGFCGYELRWKARRLRRDLTRLQAVVGQFAQLQGELTDAQRRLARTGPR
jgi:hypothetical protein